LSRIEIEKPGLALRIFRFPLTLMVLGFLLFMAAYFGAAVLGGKAMPWHHTVGQPIAALIAAVAGIGLFKLFRRYVEGEADSEFPLALAGRELGAGLLGGFALFSAMTAVVWALGGISFEGLRGQGALWSMLTMAIVSGTFEEILFRGVLFRQVEAMLGSWAALALTSAFFGVVHIDNPGATWFSSFAIAMEAGILLGAAYMLTRRLWLPIAIHAAWNFTQGWVFSVPVSGGEAPQGLLITTRAGPEWLTGGAFGLEASVVAMVVATAAGLLMAWQAVRSGDVRSAMWNRQS